MRALLLKGRSTYDATPVFIEEVAAAIKTAGGEAVVIDLSGRTQEVLEPLATIAADWPTGRFDLVFSIGLFGELRDSRGRSVAEIVGAPHVVQYVDYPLSHHARLRATPPETRLLVVDPSHVTAIHSVFGEARFRYVAFSPHGAISGGLPPGDPHPANRIVPLLFPGTFYKPGPALWEGLPVALRRIYEAATETALSAEFVPALDAMDQALALLGRSLNEAQRASLRLNAFSVHERVRAHRRYEMLRAITRAKLPLHVFGQGYDKDLYRFKSVTYLGDATLPEVLQAMRRSRAVLSINANFGRGSHERPLTALLAGAAAVTDRSTFYEDAFAPDEILQLSSRSLDRDLHALSRALEDPDQLSQMAARGQRRVLDSQLWAHRLSAIAKAAA